MFYLFGLFSFLRKRKTIIKHYLNIFFLLYSKRDMPPHGWISHSTPVNFSLLGSYKWQLYELIHTSSQKNNFGCVILTLYCWLSQKVKKATMQQKPESIRANKVRILFTRGRDCGQSPWSEMIIGLHTSNNELSLERLKVLSTHQTFTIWILDPRQWCPIPCFQDIVKHHDPTLFMFFLYICSCNCNILPRHNKWLLSNYVWSTNITRWGCVRGK